MNSVCWWQNIIYCPSDKWVVELDGRLWYRRYQTAHGTFWQVVRVYRTVKQLKAYVLTLMITRIT